MRLLRCALLFAISTPSFPISPRHSRFPPRHSRFHPVIPAKAGIQMIAAKLATRNQAQTTASGSLLPLWEKARMRVSPRLRAALRARRPRSQGRKPTHINPQSEKGSAVPVFTGMTLLRFVLGFIWRAWLQPPRHSRFRGNDGGIRRMGIRCPRFYGDDAVGIRT